MPYIKTEKRNKITPVVSGPKSRIEMDHIECAGDLNYAFTMLAIDYLNRKECNYQNINDIIGALEGCKLELYRRRVSFYEDRKCNDNGEVY